MQMQVTQYSLVLFLKQLRTHQASHTRFNISGYSSYSYLPRATRPVSPQQGLKEQDSTNKHGK